MAIICATQIGIDPNQKSNLFYMDFYSMAATFNGARTVGGHIFARISATTSRPSSLTIALLLGLVTPFLFQTTRLHMIWVGAWPCPKCESDNVLPLL